MKHTELHPLAHVLGVDVDAVDMEGALTHVATALRNSRKGYVCVAGVHGVMEAQRSPLVSRIYAGSEMTIPDGMPLVWVGRLQGHASMQRVTGPDLMLEIFKRKEFSEVTHFLYGGVEGVADQLRDNFTRQFPWVRIVGTCTPPFHDLSSAEEQQLIARIEELKPDIIWIGLGCPKQEHFMSRFSPILEAKLMFGVGAAFDYHTGRIRDCAVWIKRAGLQWLHRLLQDPRRLWSRYLRNNPAFIWLIILQLTGLREYSAPAASHRPASSRSTAATP
jgi:N-acetylglucosaminyldiphosphoundecaprenol N-acetyl-beta-D-mannosaminyltransferase